MTAWFRRTFARSSPAQPQLAAVEVELETLAYMRETATEMSYPSILEALEALSEYREEAAAVDALVEA
ncbi:hypothetical protein, partial [Acinetobacter baumannii]|uniref:hypothetical protein n=1 Tax=Acinetobacter baumannii TaxID=470 RepID=UPI00197AE76B